MSFDVFSPTISHTHKMDYVYSYLSLITTPATRSGKDGDGEPSDARRTARRDAPRAVRAADGREQTPLDERRESSGISTAANDVSEARSEPHDPRSRGLASTGVLLRG